MCEKRLCMYHRAEENMVREGSMRGLSMTKAEIYFSAKQRAYVC